MDRRHGVTTYPPQAHPESRYAPSQKTHDEEYRRASSSREYVRTCPSGSPGGTIYGEPGGGVEFAMAVFLRFFVPRQSLFFRDEAGK
jgi:hypothetical protein